MVDQIKGILPHAILSSPHIGGIKSKPVQPLNGDFLAKASLSLQQKYGSKAFEPLALDGARDKLLTGRSLLPEGALGSEGAVNGTSGAKLNFFA